MVMDKTCEGRTLMLADGTTALLLPAGAGGGAGGREGRGGRKEELVGAGDLERERAPGEGL